MRVQYYSYKNFKLQDSQLGSDEDMMSGDRDAHDFKSRYSFVSFCHHAKRNSLFIGTTNTAGDLLLEFDVGNKTFRSCNYGSGYWDPTEVKIHKGLWLNEKEDAIYFGTATLSPRSQTINSKGGKLSRYKINENQFELIAQPVAGEYYQGTMYDQKRNMLYLLTNESNSFGAYDITNQKLLRCDSIEAIPHIGVIDDSGGVWICCGLSTPVLCKYVPETNNYVFPENCAIPEGNASTNLMYLGAGPIDSAVKGNDGTLYFGTASGIFFELNPNTYKMKYIGKPFPGHRLPGLSIDPDGNVLICGGVDKAPHVAIFDVKKGTLKDLGLVKADDGEACYRCHEIVSIDHKFYVAETDNPVRSGYLWEVEL